MSDEMQRARVARSLLFVPATRPEVFDKACASGADIVCVDLEDAVPPGAKAGARAAAMAFLAAPSAPGPLRAVRINPLRTGFGLGDLQAVLAQAPASGLLVLPKIAEAAEIGIVSDLLAEAGAGSGLVALIESLDGVACIDAIAAAGGRLCALFFGGVDYAAAFGGAVSEDCLDHARHRIVLAARRADLGALDVPALAFRDLDAVGAAAARARGLGFTGKAAIHPSNIAAINAAFTPSAEEIAEARRAIAAWEAAPDGLAVLDGKLIEQPVIRAMRARLALAERSDPDA